MITAIRLRMALACILGLSAISARAADVSLAIPQDTLTKVVRALGTISGRSSFCPSTPGALAPGRQNNSYPSPQIGISADHSVPSESSYLTQSSTPDPTTLEPIVESAVDRVGNVQSPTRPPPPPGVGVSPCPSWPIPWVWKLVAPQLEITPAGVTLVATIVATMGAQTSIETARFPARFALGSPAELTFAVFGQAPVHMTFPQGRVVVGTVSPGSRFNVRYPVSLAAIDVQSKRLELSVADLTVALSHAAVLITTNLTFR